MGHAGEVLARLLEDDELGVAIAAHAVNGSGKAGSGGEAVAAGGFGGDGNSLGRAADDVIGRVEG